VISHGSAYGPLLFQKYRPWLSALALPLSLSPVLVEVMSSSGGDMGIVSMSTFVSKN